MEAAAEPKPSSVYPNLGKIDRVGCEMTTFLIVEEPAQTHSLLRKGASPPLS
jgi:hypothetical protein